MQVIASQAEYHHGKRKHRHREHTEEYRRSRGELEQSEIIQPLVVKDENGAGRLYRNFLADYASIGGKTEVI